MFNMIVGIVIGAVLVTFWPEISNGFVSSGLRDHLVSLLHGV